jgi:4'-phosphopantetheinyl transferase
MPSPSVLRPVLSPRERIELASRPAQEHLQSFLTMWAAKAAAAKAIGWPLHRALTDIEVSLEDDARLTRLAKDRCPQGWSLATPADGAQRWNCAVVLASPPVE